MTHRGAPVPLMGQVSPFSTSANAEVKPEPNAARQMASRTTRWLVDYDLPADHRRKRFYRAISRYLRERGVEETAWSTGSVVWTASEGFAWEVYNQARRVGGTAHVWKAERLDTEF